MPECRDCGNKEIFFERGTYEVTLICDATTGEWREDLDFRRDIELICCGKCDSKNIDTSDLP